MKKILLIAVIGILLLSGMEAVALKSDIVPSGNTTKENRDFTHTVFAEDSTATWCGYCHYAREALDAVYTSGDYPFFYVCLVDDKDTHAAARNLEYNIYGFPTVFFDSGNNVQVGGYTGNEADYRVAIPQCGARTVADIDIALSVVWQGDATMDISVGVTNNEATPYAGHIHVYVCEIESSLNWKDTTGHPYTFPFLDYAFNEPISMAASDTWENSITWNGHNYNSGMGQDFGSIQYGNIAVIATVFNNTWHQGYAYPPSQNPFDAYYVDDAAGFIVGGTGPYPPSKPNPADGATTVDINTDLSWTGGGSPGSTITYDVYFGTTSPPPKVAGNQSATTYNPGQLLYGTTYFWKVVAWDQDDNTAPGPTWQFNTLINPNSPPATPTITGPVKGTPGKIYRFTITATDPESDMVSGFIDWGDNTTTDWVGPYDSGEAFSVTHSWAEKATFTVKVKVKDEHGAESAWATLDVKMPTTFGITTPFMSWLFEHFPNAFPLLRHLLGV
jgi:hypothetical protein